MRYIEKQLQNLIEMGYVKMRWGKPEISLMVTPSGLQAIHLLTHLVDDKQTEILNEQAFGVNPVSK